MSESEHVDALRARKLELQIEQLERSNQWARADSDDCGIFTFYGQVSPSSVETVMTDIAHWSRMNPGEPLVIILNSPGGSVLDGLCFYDFLEHLKKEDGHEVTIVGLGMIASMAGPIMQAADHRIMGANAHFLIHEVSAGAIGNVSEMQDKTKFAKMLQDRLIDILLERSTLTRSQIKRKMERKDWWFDAMTALEHGFVDEIR